LRNIEEKKLREIFYILLMEKPSLTAYTIYSKSQCAYCEKAKLLLKDEAVHVIDCDKYLVEDRTRFLQTMHHYAGGVKCKTFPMIFLKGVYIGGFAETKKYYDSALFSTMNF